MGLALASLGSAADFKSRHSSQPPAPPSPAARRHRRPLDARIRVLTLWAPRVVYAEVRHESGALRLVRSLARRVPGERLEQPRFRHLPVALGGFRRDSQDAGDFIDGQSAKVAQL